MILDIKIAIGVPMSSDRLCVVSHKIVDFFTLDMIVLLANISLKDCSDKQKLLEVARAAKSCS